MEFDSMPLDEIRSYLSAIGDRAEAVSVVLTDGIILTGKYSIRDDPVQPLGLYAFGANMYFRVQIPSERIAGILQQVTSRSLSAQALDSSLLVSPAVKAGLEVESILWGGVVAPGSPWTQSETIRYQKDAMLYFDVGAISARSGGINSIGGSYVAGITIGWQRKLVSKAKRLCRRHVIGIGSHCAEPRTDLTVKGYVEFFDVSDVQPSSEGGPLLEVEGVLWTAAVVRPSPPAKRNANDPWALCYFRQDCMSLGASCWEYISQPVRVYGDKQPHRQKLDLGVADCYLKVRAAACFPRRP